MAAQTVDQAFANVQDFVLSTDADASFSIQRAIDSGRHVLFPAGTYVIGQPVPDGTPATPSSGIDFKNDFQNATFLAGAILQPYGDRGKIRISGKNQVITGLYVNPSPPPTSGAMVDIDGADGLRLEDFFIYGTNPATHLRIRNVTRCALYHGEVRGEGTAEYDSDGETVIWETFQGVGLEIGENANEVSAYSCGFNQVATNVLVSGDVHALAFEDCNMEEWNGTAFLITGSVVGLTLEGCHFENKWDGAANIGIAAGASIRGGNIVNCVLGGGEPIRLERSAVKIEGSVSGLSLVTCYRNADRNATTQWVWSVAAGAFVSNCRDESNFWANCPPGYRIQGDPTGIAVIDNVNASMTLSATSLRLGNQKTGFFVTDPASRSTLFSTTVAASRFSSNAAYLLSALLQDLAALGLIKMV